jgi:hypothetical protein
MNSGYKLFLFAALAFPAALISTTGAFADDPTCKNGASIAFERKADLPRPVLDIVEKLRPMADADEPFQASDVLSDPPLPFYRFTSATQSGCDLTINYESGGRAHATGIILLRQTGDTWTVREGSD